MKWPESCGYYSPEQFCGIHDCTHPCNTHHGGKPGSCTPRSCPFNRMEKLHEKIDGYQERYDALMKYENPLHGDYEEMRCLKGELEFLNRKMSKYLNEENMEEYQQ